MEFMSKINDTKYVEGLLRNYKKNKARLRILELNKLSYEDNELRGIDYSREVVQTSNISTLDEITIKREEEYNKLKYLVNLTEALIDGLDSRKDNQYRKIANYYYIENMTYTEVMPIVGVYTADHFYSLGRKVLRELTSLMEVS